MGLPALTPSLSGARHSLSVKTYGTLVRVQLLQKTDVWRVDFNSRE